MPEANVFALVSKKSYEESSPSTTFIDFGVKDSAECDGELEETVDGKSPKILIEDSLFAGSRSASRGLTLLKKTF